MKNQKMKLDELKVQSFVTDFDKQQDQTKEVNGGGSYLVFCDIYYPVIILNTMSCAGGCTTTYRTYDTTDILVDPAIPVEVVIDQPFGG
jgi:hypothetical protein